MDKLSQKIVQSPERVPPAQDQQNFVRTSKFFSFYLVLFKNKFKNLIQTSKFIYIFSFRELHIDNFTDLIAFIKKKIISKVIL
jgi:hypothetical protein